MENHLIREKSPYLLQHAHNPVDWYPWGREAFEKAARESRPVFLSIGYSTCHWCHVMERESFEDLEVAKLLNREFVAVKVDREERPDIDAVYMGVCQAMTGAGGWPLTILMTPEQNPFYAATYLPKRARHGTPGLIELLAHVAGLWRNEREQLLQAGDQIGAFMRKERSATPETPDKELLEAAADLFRKTFDARFGGFGKAPKFPSPHNLLFLLRYAEREQDSTARAMAEQTLSQLYRGGIFDHIGGGLSRYSTDERWLAPHFEKMLYDNALIAYAWLEAYRVTGRPLYEVAARRTLDYVLRELTDEAGGFYCGQDADSDGVEGKYYLFTPGEVEEQLGKTGGEEFCRWFDITPAGNFEGKSIPNLLENSCYEKLPPQLEVLRERLYAYRRERVALHRDDKVLTSWNALMIASLAKASRVLGERKYLEAAYRARRFLADHLTDRQGRLFVRWREGEAAHDGHLDDYAFYAWALLELYRADFDVSCLRDAVRMTEQMTARFAAQKEGGFYLYADDAEQLISRPKELYDGAMPSGNSVAALVLVQLAKLTGEHSLQEEADRQLAFLAGNAREYPAGYSFALLAVIESIYPSMELVCAARTGLSDEAVALLRTYPHLYVLVKTSENEAELSTVAPFTAAYPVPATGEAYYLCKGGACAAPVGTIAELRLLLDAPHS